MTKQTLLEEEVSCKEVKKAFTYFATKYWRDLVRPTLLSLCCEAVGGDPQTTTSAAISMSLISGGIDIHDDIIDESEKKRGRKTVYGKFGKDIALLVGDALLFKGLIILNKLAREVDEEKFVAVSKTVKTMFFELGDAEALELKFRKRIDLSPNEYLGVIQKKAADVEAHTCIGAILGNGTKREIKILRKYGKNLGMLFILADDNADMSRPKELGHRIRNEHLPFALLLALEDPNVKPKIISLLKKQKERKVDSKEFFEVVYDSGAFNKVEKIMKNLVREGITGLTKLRFCRTELQLLIESNLLCEKIYG